MANEDVHVYKLDRQGRTHVMLVEIARQDTLKHYGGTVVREFQVSSESGVAGLRKELSASGINSHINEGASGLVFWSPDGTNYSTKSEPK